MVELLAPAGSFECMKAAVRAGADAVYMGGQFFSARAYAENPDNQGLIDALDYCHFHGKKLYLTVNTLFKDDELENQLYDFIAPLYQEGLDACIVQDYGVIRFLREHFPELPIHASTQMAVAGFYGTELLREMGVSRLILPRELSLSEIKRVTERGHIETECFVHGALCYCYSGMCLMSSLIGGRSGNRGRCAQVCRMGYPQEHLMNLKDLCTLNILPDIIDTGVCSLKIEGRMKSPRYTAGVTSIYRKYIDLYKNAGREGYKVAASDIHLLRELFDRGGTSTGFFETHNGKTMIFKGEKQSLRVPDEKLLSRIDTLYLGSDNKVAIKVKARIITGSHATLSLDDGVARVTVTGDEVQSARTSPLSRESAAEQISKFGDSPYELQSLDLEISNDAFLPVSSINRLRRDAVSALYKEKINGYKRTNF